MKLSIIVPVYNIAQYLNDCVQSILEQSFHDWELVLVNDGSTDQSPALCEEWAKKDTRIRVVHKANGGLSDTRNAGLLEAKGEYIHFLDGDDYYVADNVLQTLMEQVEQYQLPDTLLFCRVDRYEDTGKEDKERPYNTDFINQSSSTTITFEHLLRMQRFNMSSCFQILRREFLMDNQIFFEKGLLSEDVDWSLALWQHLKTVKAVNCYGHFNLAFHSDVSELSVYVSEVDTSFAERCRNIGTIAVKLFGFLISYFIVWFFFCAQAG